MFRLKTNLEGLFRGKLALAPMEDVTESPFRFICKKLGTDLVYSEFISSEALIRTAPKAYAKMFFLEDERPVGIQIFGSKTDVMAEAAKIAESYKPDFIDINCGCWVKNVALRNAGAGLLRDLRTMRGIAETVVKNSSLPVTLKTRLGWDEKNAVIVDVARMCEDIGIVALTVHCRFRNQANKGFADWSWIKRIKDTGIKIPIILNGNIHTPEDVKTAFQEFEADSVMIGQAAISNPWIFRQAKFYLKNGYHEPEPTIEERVDLCLEHLKLAVKLKGEKYGVIEFRKHFTGYLRNLPNISKFRLELMQFKEFEPLKEKLLQFKEHYTKIFEERCS